jgi:hypothetical protein
LADAGDADDHLARAASHTIGGLVGACLLRRAAAWLFRGLGRSGF